MSMFALATFKWAQLLYLQHCRLTYFVEIWNPKLGCRLTIEIKTILPASFFFPLTCNLGGSTHGQVAYNHVNKVLRNKLNFALVTYNGFDRNIHKKCIRAPLLSFPACFMCNNTSLHAESRAETLLRKICFRTWLRVIKTFTLRSFPKF